MIRLKPYTISQAFPLYSFYPQLYISSLFSFFSHCPSSPQLPFFPPSFSLSKNPLKTLIDHFSLTFFALINISDVQQSQIKFERELTSFLSQQARSQSGNDLALRSFDSFGKIDDGLEFKCRYIANFGKKRGQAKANCCKVQVFWQQGKDGCGCSQQRDVLENIEGIIIKTNTESYQNAQETSFQRSQSCSFVCDIQKSNFSLFWRKRVKAQHSPNQLLQLHPKTIRTHPPLNFFPCLAPSSNPASFPSPKLVFPALKPSAPPLGYNNNLSLFPNHPMQYINTRPLTFIVNRVRDSSRVQPIFDQINQACNLNLKFQWPQTVLATAKRINQRQVRQKKYKPSAQKMSNINWVFGEFKIFVWTVVYKCLINGLQLQHLTIDIAKEIQNIFKSKSLCFIQYEIKMLISQKYSIISEHWEPHEIKLLSQIMEEHLKKGNINWRSISFELFFKSNAEYFRNINHCREKWFNHLNPIVKKGEWTTQEDIKIFRLIKIHGLKWSKISKCMGKIRTQHMVKNRFNKYYKLWKLDSDTSIETIYRIYKDKIEKPYMKKMRDLGREVNLDIKLEEEEDGSNMVEENGEGKVVVQEEVQVDQIVLPTQESNAQKDQTNELTPPKQPQPEPTIKLQPSFEPQIKVQENPYQVYYPFLDLCYPPLKYSLF